MVARKISAQLPHVYAIKAAPNLMNLAQQIKRRPDVFARVKWR
jgi:hypothetical protein